MDDTQKTNADSRPSGRSLADRITLWVGLAGSLLTIVLTVFNARTKNAIDLREADLKDLQYQLQQRTTGIEESKERVDRYKWVLSLLPSLTDKDESKRNFTVALVRLALTKTEAEQLFSGLQLSKDQDVRQAAQEGYASIENQEVSRLVLQMDAGSADDRKHAVALLERDYALSPVALSLVLDRLTQDKISALTPSGLINAIYFLGATDTRAWTKVNADRARDVVARLRLKSPGPQTSGAVEKLAALLKQLP